MSYESRFRVGWNEKLDAYIWMPVKLSQALWVQSHDCSSNGGGDWEVARIDNRKCTTATGRWGNWMLR